MPLALLVSLERLATLAPLASLAPQVTLIGLSLSCMQSIPSLHACNSATRFFHAELHPSLRVLVMECRIHWLHRRHWVHWRHWLHRQHWYGNGSCCPCTGILYARCSLTLLWKIHLESTGNNQSLCVSRSHWNYRFHWFYRRHWLYRFHWCHWLHGIHRIHWRHRCVHP